MPGADVFVDTLNFSLCCRRRRSLATLYLPTHAPRILHAISRCCCCGCCSITFQFILERLPRVQVFLFKFLSHSLSLWLLSRHLCVLRVCVRGSCSLKYFIILISIITFIGGWSRLSSVIACRSFLVSLCLDNRKLIRVNGIVNLSDEMTMEYCLVDVVAIGCDCCCCCLLMPAG